MKELNEYEFFHDVLAILTLPTEDVSVLISGWEDDINPEVFLRKLMKWFAPEFTDEVKPGGISAVACIIGKHVYVTLEMYKGYAVPDGWDYKIYLDIARPRILTMEGSENIIRESSYWLGDKLTEYL